MEEINTKATNLNSIQMLKCINEKEWGNARYFRNKYFFGPYGIKDPYEWTFSHGSHAHFVLYEENEIIGYTHIQLWLDKRAAIRIIIVEENKRKQKAGSLCLNLIEVWLKSLGIKSIHVESRQASLSFYLKNGYTEMPFDDPEGHESDPSDIPVGKVLS